MHVSKVVTRLTVGFYVGCMTNCVLIGRNHGKLSHFTGSQSLSSGEIGSIEVRVD